jgi:iron(III) transport system substrate-binding protein
MAIPKRERWVKSLISALVCIISTTQGITWVPAADMAAVIKEIGALRDEARETRLIQGAKQEGRIVLYGTTGIDDMKIVFDSFKNKYPFLDVGHFRGGALAVHNRVVTEARAGKFEADVIEATALTAIRLKENNLLEPYVSPRRAGIAKAFMDNDGFWTGWFQQVVAMIYNTKLVRSDEVPKSYEELTDAKWRGRISVDQEDDDIFATLMNHWGKEKGMSFFKRLAQNKPTVRKGHNLQTNLVAAGETHLAPWIFAFRPLTMKQKGAPIDIALLDPVLSDPKYVMVAKNSQHPYASMLFTDWLLSDGQAIVVEKLGRTGTRAGLRERFPELVRPQYLVEGPERLGGNSKLYAELFCKTFGSC